jgi:hypothetical protein
MNDIGDNLRPAHFRLAGLDGRFLGWSEGESWQGHAVPLFSLEVGKAIVMAYDRQHAGAAAYDAEADVFRFGEPPQEYAAVAREIGDKIEKLYPIGARTWQWQEVTA